MVGRAHLVDELANPEPHLLAAIRLKDGLVGDHRVGRGCSAGPEDQRSHAAAASVRDPRVERQQVRSGDSSGAGVRGDPELTGGKLLELRQQRRRRGGRHGGQAEDPYDKPEPALPAECHRVAIGLHACRERRPLALDLFIHGAKLIRARPPPVVARRGSSPGSQPRYDYADSPSRRRNWTLFGPRHVGLGPPPSAVTRARTGPRYLASTERGRSYPLRRNPALSTWALADRPSGRLTLDLRGARISPRKQQCVGLTCRASVCRR
jgi:hypothetical protein